MFSPEQSWRSQAKSIWQAGVDAVKPSVLLANVLKDQSSPLAQDLNHAEHIWVVGAGKAGAAMSECVEKSLSDKLDRLKGKVNVPGEQPRSLRGICLWPARPPGSNQPTSMGQAGAESILKIVQNAGPNDVCLCLLSGGGSALLPAPCEGISLEEKQRVTRLLHACGATINEMNAVRKHLSRTKGGRLAGAFHGKSLYSLIISDVVGDPLDVIASGPTAVDPTTFADAVGVLEKYKLTQMVREQPGEREGDELPGRVLKFLNEGAKGLHQETLKVLPSNIHNLVIGNSRLALDASQARAEELGYRVLNLGDCIEGETQSVARQQADLVRGILDHGTPLPPPVCILSGGETTVTLGNTQGKGGRNQEFALAFLVELGAAVDRVISLAGGTDGEDGPTDAAGGFADASTWNRSLLLDETAASYLKNHDAYHFLEKTESLLRTGLTQTNVMDLRVILVMPKP